MRGTMTGGRGALAGMLLVGGAAMAADAPPVQTMPADPVARRFGMREKVIDISIAPDGRHIALVVPGRGRSEVVMIAGIDGGGAKAVTRASGDPLHLTGCGWTSPRRLVCREYGLAMVDSTRAPFTRIVAIDADGSNARAMGRTQNNAMRISQFDGRVIDWLAGTDGSVMMMRDYVPEGDNPLSAGAANQPDGQGVDRVDSVSGRGRTIERPVAGATDYITDGRGVVRIVETQEQRSGGMLTGTTTYRYRLAGDRAWKPFSKIGPAGGGLQPIAVDAAADATYALKTLDGRSALYRVRLDGSMASELVYANPTVDVGGVVTIGRGGRVIGASYVTDRRQIEYFDPEYRKLAASLAKALPKLPLIYFQGASADEKTLLVFAGSDVDPGHYYMFDRTTRHLDEITPARPDLDGLTLSPVTSVSYPAADGTMVPAYLTLPPGGGKRLPTIVMPHGGPASRDEWGFDWLAQYFAQRGYAVLQPQFRGSSGYGDAWYVDNGFKSWKTAIGDIAEGARWLQKQGVADPDRLAIVGWSYGGYAALQANVVDPALFKAVVAIAPVTSLAMMKSDAADYTNAAVVNRFVGSGAHIVEGSPLKHPEAFRAPVLLFHGDEDINVAIGHSQAMDRALRAADKQSRLVVYKGLDHQLDDTDARTDMLTQTDAFLKAVLHITPAASPGS